MLAVISDVHSNYRALSLVLREIEKLGCSHILSLGDIAGYGNEINQCIDALRERKATSLLGNHDYYLTQNVPCNRSKSVNRSIDHQRSVITQENLHWLSQSFPVYYKQGCMFMHGGPLDPLDQYLKDPQEEDFSNWPANFFFSGHTHVQKLIKWEKKTYCNPGSVGLPRDGVNSPAYAIFDGTEVELHRVQ